MFFLLCFAWVGCLHIYPLHAIDNIVSPLHIFFRSLKGLTQFAIYDVETTIQQLRQRCRFQRDILVWMYITLGFLTIVLCTPDKHHRGNGILNGCLMFGGSRLGECIVNVIYLFSVTDLSEKSWEGTYRTEHHVNMGLYCDMKDIRIKK